LFLSALLRPNSEPVCASAAAACGFIARLLGTTQ